MTHDPAVPLVFVELLADAHSRLTGLHWWHEPAPADGLLPWLRDRDYLELAQGLSCVWTEDEVAQWPPLVREALVLAPSEVVQARRLVRADKVFPTRLSAASPWVAGRWYLQAGPRAHTEVTASRGRALQLLQLVADDADTHELEDIFRQDAVLSYQLLRLVNSVALGGQRHIASFAQAILILGREPLRRWLHLLLFSARDDDPRSHLLAAHVALRARGLELLAQEAGFDRSTQDLAFMAGMFSLLDVLFGQALPAVLAPLKLDPELRSALLEQGGELGQLLGAWLAVERGDAAPLRDALTRWDVSAGRLNSVLLQACLWVCRLTRDTEAAPHD
jgi:HDOD domain